MSDDISLSEVIMVLRFPGDCYQPIVAADSPLAGNRSSNPTQTPQLDLAALPAVRKNKKVKLAVRRTLLPVSSRGSSV